MKPRTRRILHRLVFALVAISTLVALFYAEEDWRGARVWDNLRRELAARGESLDPKDFIPPPVPDDQNLAMAPLFVRAFRYKVDARTGLLTFDPQLYANNPNIWELNCMPEGQGPSHGHKVQSQGSWQSGHRVDLSVWQAYYLNNKDFAHSAQPGVPAEDVLLALTRYEPLLDELAQDAGERPLARFPVNYTLRPAAGISLKHLTPIQSLQRTLCLRADARLALGQATAARRDVNLAFRLNESIVHEPILISGLVQATDIEQILQPIWEGLQARHWSAADLEALQTDLHGVDLLRSYLRGIQGGERAIFVGQLPDDFQNWSFARDVQKSFLNGEYSTAGSAWLGALLPILPRGWYVQNSTLAGRLTQTYLIDAVDLPRHRVMPVRSDDFSQAMNRLPASPYTFLIKVYLPVFQKVILKFAQAQAAVDQAMTACALERYYLDRHAYPERLDTLVPVYLDRVPNDVIDGASLRYRLTSDGRYQLYSIGWDGRDDGGTLEWPADRTWRRGATKPASGKPLPFPAPVKDRGDWVWQYAPAEPPDPPANRSRLE